MKRNNGLNTITRGRLKLFLTNGETVTYIDVTAFNTHTGGDPFADIHTSDGLIRGIKISDIEKFIIEPMED